MINPISKLNAIFLCTVNSILFCIPIYITEKSRKWFIKYSLMFSNQDQAGQIERMKLV